MPEHSKPGIVYGVHGYGRGHAARAQAILPELTKKYDVLVLAGDDAYEHLSKDYRVVRIPMLGYFKKNNGRRSVWLTISRNIPPLLDLLVQGPIFQMVADEVKKFGPDMIISDSEAWTHRVGRSMEIPRISFDHYGMMAFCKIGMSPWERFLCNFETMIYRMMVCRPKRFIVAAFYDGLPTRENIRPVGAILRQEVRQLHPTRGDYLLCYFSNPESNFSPQVEQALQSLNCPAKIYGPNRQGKTDNLEFCPTSNLPFLKDLAGAKAVFATSGNQLISEALYYAKGLLLIPEDSLEQRLNARFIKTRELGMETNPQSVSTGLLEEFLARSEEFSQNAQTYKSQHRDGLEETLEAIDEAFVQLKKRNQ